MGRCWLLLPCLVVLSAAAVPPAIPERFRGRWSPNLAACAEGEPLEEIRITAHTIDYWEWTHQPYAVSQNGPDSISIRAKLYESDVDHPERPAGTVRLRLGLLAGGQQLAYRVNNEAQRLYVRCEGERPE